MGQCCIARGREGVQASKRPEEIAVSSSPKYVEYPPPPSLPLTLNGGIRIRGNRSAACRPSFAAYGSRPCRRCVLSSWLDVSSGVEERWLGGVEEVPPYQRRPFILTWYRLERPQLRHFWRLHNELVNMWTHILAACFLMLRFARWISLQDFNACLEWPRGLYTAAVMAFFITSVGVFSISVQHHWTCCAEEDVFVYWNCIDRSACLLVVVMGFFSGIPIGYHCLPQLKAVYCWSSIAICGMTSVFMFLAKDGAGRKGRIIIIGACFALVPAGHWLVVSPEGRAAIGSRLIVAMLSAICAAIFFTQRIPERYVEGRFDLLGASHQWWHIFIFTTVLLYCDCLTIILDLINADSFCVM